jgi:hypothetical protein
MRFWMTSPNIVGNMNNALDILFRRMNHNDMILQLSRDSCLWHLGRMYVERPGVPLDNYITNPFNASNKEISEAIE